MLKPFATILQVCGQAAIFSLKVQSSKLEVTRWMLKVTVE